MGWIKSMILGYEVTLGISKDFQQFGTYVHEMLFLGRSKIKLSHEEHVRATKMLNVLRTNKTVQKMLKNTVCEVTVKTKLKGVNIQFTPDAVQDKKKGRDLKTTVCSTLEDFIAKAFEYGYFRQGETYSQAAKLNEFVIIGIQKQKPFKVFIVLCSMHKEKMEYSKNELEFLLYFYKNYGNFNKLVEKTNKGTSKRKTPKGKKAGKGKTKKRKAGRK